jgi:hypothetical protein
MTKAAGHLQEKVKRKLTANPSSIPSDKAVKICERKRIIVHREK